MPFVSSSIYQKATQLALKEGLSSKLLSQYLSLPAIINGDKYIPIDLLWDVYELADQHLNPGFSIRQGMQLNSDDYGTLGLSWKTCWKAREVLDRTERYMILVTDEGSIQIEESEGITKLSLFRDPERRGTEMSNETSLVMLSGVIREVTAKDIHPVNILFTHSSDFPEPFHEYFSCQVSFGQRVNAIHYKTSDIDIPTLKADKSIHQFLVERMDEETKGIRVNANKLVSEIKNLIIEALPSGIPSVIQLGDHLGMSARTLKRRLSEKGLTFREVVQNVQEEISIDLLKNSDCSIGEIAFQTGFSEQSAFNRAFKRWKDQSPVEYRKSC